jgi:hypothetical protein
LGKAVEGKEGAGGGRLSPHRNPGTEQQEALGYVEPQVSAHADQADQASLEVREQEGADRNHGGDRSHPSRGAGQSARQREAAQRDRRHVIDPSVQPGRNRHNELHEAAWFNGSAAAGMHQARSLPCRRRSEVLTLRLGNCVLEGIDRTARTLDGRWNIMY